MFPLWLSGLRRQHCLCEDVDSILALLSGLRIWHCHKLQCTLQMQLGSSVAVAVAQAPAAAAIQPLAQELPYVAGAAVNK